MGAEYDVIVVGGGIAGSALGARLAGAGIRTAILERERAFKDRVRGELLTPWGNGEAQHLGINACLLADDGHELPYIDLYSGPILAARRNMVETTPQASACVSFYHPTMQERCLSRARDAGCSVYREVRVTAVESGQEPAVLASRDGHVDRITARLVVVADGRVSELRRNAGFAVQRDPEKMFVAGVFLEGVDAIADNALVLMFTPPEGAVYLIPQGRGRARAYLAYRSDEPYRLSGTGDFGRFISESMRRGASQRWYEGTRVAGPLASFASTDCWVTHPYRTGVALVGDAAGSNDPVYGQGLSLALRDARVLSNQLLDASDWDSAAHAYADERDRYYGAIHTITRWMAQLNFDVGPEADARRARALPLIAREPQRVPDHLNSGPDLPLDESVRRCYFGED